MDTTKIYNEVRELFCTQDKALKELIWTIATNQKLSRPKNVLLVGGTGTGKTTMVELVASKMEMPLAKVSGLCASNGYAPEVLYEAFTKLYILNNKDNFHGIVLIEDMRNCFLYGGFSDLNSMITSGTFHFDNRLMDISDTMFIGEVNNYKLEDCFTKKPEFTLENLDEAFLSDDFDSDEIKMLISDLIEFGNEENDASDIYADQFRDALKRTFLSIECSKAFSKKIFLEGMKTEDICQALKSPISELQVYQDDLCDEYMQSNHFINSVASHISESLIGLHDLDDAVSEVASFDSKRKMKVYKDNSLMRL